MCGKFQQSFDLSHLAALLKLPPSAALPSASATPGKPALTLVQEASRATAVTMRWGFASAPGLGVRPVINARAETLASKPMFAAAYKTARCALPVSTYCEGAVQVGITGVPVFYLGGMYQRGVDGMHEFTVITRAPAPDLLQVHDRMPLVLADRIALHGWLDSATQPVEFPDFSTAALQTDTRQLGLF